MARKEGIQYITGDYVLFLDSDDVFTRDALKLLSGKIARGNTDIVFFGYTNTPEGNKIVPLSLRNPEDYLKIFFIRDSYIPSALWSRAYKKELVFEAYSKMNNFPAFMAEDVYVSIVIHSYAKTITTLKKSLVYYSTKGNSNVKKFDLSVYESWLSSYRVIFDQIVIFVKKYKPEYLQYCNNILIRFVKEFFNKMPPDLPENERTLLLSILRKYIDDNIFYAYLKESNSRWIQFQDFCNVYQVKNVQIVHGIKYLVKCIIGLRHFYNNS
jgi:glycosyltransferase involved in cell wall biosynthesis